MAKFANGISDDLLGTTLLATKAPIILAPAMHTEMWLNSATVENVSILENRGIHIIQPATGPLTSGDVGAGRLPDAKQIVQKALAVTGSKDLLGKRVLVTAGGTHAGIDAVRFIGNRSSGKQGIAIAEEAFLRGAEVTLVLANVDYEGVVDVLHVSTNEELDTCVQAQLPDLDVLIMAAAIVDYQIDKPSSLKIKRSKSGLTLTLKPSKDLLAGFTEKIRKLKTSTFVVGFAAETATGIELEQFALGKLKGKGCNLVVANDVSDGKVFSKSETEIIIVSDAGTLEKFKGSKYVAARHLVDQIVSRI
jgi:phosphopantothenoylcysteine decarboxylase/phosphopantothenate--cysteine ligase